MLYLPGPQISNFLHTSQLEYFFSLDPLRYILILSIDIYYAYYV